jgi:hypothetical protein
VPVAVLAAAAAIAVLVSLAVRRRTPALGHQGRRRMTRRERMLTAIAALLALAAVMTARVVAAGRRGRPVPARTHVTQVRGSASHAGWHLTAGTGAVVLAVVLLAAGAAALLVRSRHRPAAPSSGAPAVLAEAAEGGRRALLDASDPREAIIAAYLAMERRLADSGFVLTQSRTAGEVLYDAAGGGYVNREAGTVLVRLFERARFSAAPLTTADRDHALAALDVLAARVLR